MVDENKNWTRLVEYILGIVSISGCIFMLIVFLCYRKLRNFSFECVAYLTISSMLTTISYMINYIEVDSCPFKISDKCKAQAFMMVLFDNSQYIWSMLIAYYIHQMVIYFEENDKKSHKYTRIKFLMAGYLLPLMMALIALWRDVYGPSGRWCWINTTTEKTEYKVFSFVFYFVVWILIFLNFLFNYRVIKYLSRVSNTEKEREMLNRYHKKIMVYPIIQTICIMPGTIFRFLQVVLDINIIELQNIQMIFTMLQGFLYAIVYGFTTQVRKALYGTFEKFLCCCCRKKRTESISSQNSQRFNERTYSNFSSDGSYLDQPSGLIRRDISSPERDI